VQSESKLITGAVDGMLLAWNWKMGLGRKRKVVDKDNW
jgi:hypothetical protein